MRLRRFLITEPIRTTFTSVVTALASLRNHNFDLACALDVRGLARLTLGINQLRQRIPEGRCELPVLEFGMSDQPEQLAIPL